MAAPTRAVSRAGTGAGGKAAERNREGGAIAVVAAAVFIVVGAFLALSLNTGHLMNARAQLQTAVDAAALSGAAQLNGSSTGFSAARNLAVNFGGKHNVDISTVGLSTADVDPGYWDMLAKRFYPLGQTVNIGGASVTLGSTTASYVNAVKVHVLTDGAGSHNGALPVWLGAFMGGQTKAQVGATAVAVGGGPCSTDSGCTLPLVVPSCDLVDNGGNLACNSVITFYFNYGHDKIIALGNLVPGQSANNSDERKQMQDGVACKNPTVNVGDAISLGNGSDFNSGVAAAVKPALCNKPAPYKGCARMQIAVTNIGTNCGVPMNQTAPVVGFMQGVVLATNAGGVDASITMYVDCSGTSQTSDVGCASFGFGSPKWRLVQ